jgi:hypothetical protein
LDFCKCNFNFFGSTIDEHVPIKNITNRGFY